ncbi:putative xyloglucan galactosyltransferase GT11 [Silene latifolia]|uniref:putative xyloglucan galactosyltransferase GT11 n=1 Tax=Silene latifolia TaxID=37657 RepID=UPI003D76DB2A
MKQYKCLTNDSSKANAIFVPFYSGLDVGRYLWDPNATRTDETSMQLTEYVSKKPEWELLGGRDHFLVAGRITWDFSRKFDNSTDGNWGNHLLNLPEIKNMTSLLLESNPTSKSEIAIPYPTYFHPSSGIQVENWQEKMRKSKREYLFSFAGAPRPNIKESIRNILIAQCLAARGKNNCKYVHTKPDVKPETVMGLLQKSDFCLQPPGDSFTRKSVFDTILAGCIPVLFHPGSAYVQYVWHLPKDYSSYSVFIPMDELIQGNVSIEKILLDIPKEKVREMREEVIKLIPRIVYANTESKVDSFEDAFDVAVKGVLSRVDRVKMEMKGGMNVTADRVIVPDELAWKYNYFGNLDNHDWDKYFG